MLIFLSLLILWFLFFVYNRMDSQIWNQLLFFWRYDLSSIEKASLLVLFINILFIIILVRYAIIEISKNKKVSKPKSKTRKTVRKAKKETAVDL